MVIAPLNTQGALAESDVLAAVKQILSAGVEGIGSKHDASGTPQATGYMHGPQGLLSYPGVDPQVFSTMMGAIPGILDMIPFRPSLFTDPLFEVLTGQQADSGNEKEDVCDDAPGPGLLKAGILWAPFGRYERATPELEISRMGKLNDRADPIDLTLQGNPIGGNVFGASEAGASFLPNQLVNELSAAMFRRNTSMHRLLRKQAWVGNPANNSAGGGYMEFPGLELLVATGHTDAITGNALPSIDSDIKDFNFVCVDDDGDALVNALTYMVRFVRSKATRSGIDPVRWTFAMREELFYEISAIWPCSYLTYRCEFRTNDGTIVQNVSATDQIAMRDSMRQRRMLLVDGIEYPVVFDDGITELTDTTSSQLNAGQFASDIYFLPLSVQGGQAVLFAEFFNFNNQAINDAVTLLGGTTRVRSNGSFLEFVRQTNQCFVAQIQIEPRIILRTPWLAARLQHVCYQPLQHTVEPFPEDPYFSDGGETDRDGPSYHAGWKT